MVGKPRKRSSLIKLKRFIYLISPNNIRKSFYNDLDKVLSSKKVKFFQIRLKKKSKQNIIKISKKIKQITPKMKLNNVIWFGEIWYFTRIVENFVKPGLNNKFNFWSNIFF